MKVNDVYIAGIGTAETDLINTADAVERGWYDAQDRERGQLVSISVAGATPAPDLAVQAARHAMDRSGHTPEEIDALFHTSVHPQGPDGWSAQHYINRNAVNQPVTSVEIRNGCVGFFSSLHLAAAHLNATTLNRPAVLMTAADNFGTPSANRWKAAPKIFVLADGGGAVVVSRRTGFARLLAIDSVSDPELEIRHRAGESLFPPGPTVGGTLNFAQRIERSTRLAAQNPIESMIGQGSLVIETAERTLKDADTTLDEITRVVHDGYTRVALQDMFLDPLGIEEKRGIWDFTRTVGHAGPVDQIRGLEYLWASSEVVVGDKVMLISDAPGMEAACAILEIIAEPS
jgi:3-oxoacyl-[acyl-carrier-protein] synthase-3